MFNQKRGYSLVMWTAVFAIVTLAAAMFIVPVKRALTSKTLHTADYLLWTMWDKSGAVQDEGGWNHQQKGAAIGSTVHSLDDRVHESKGKVQTIINATATTTSDSSSWQ